MPLILLLLLTASLQAEQWGSYILHQELPAGVEIQADPGALRLQSLREDLLLVECFPGESQPAESSHVLLQDPQPGGWSLIVEEERLRLVGAEGEVIVHKEPLRLEWLGNTGSLEQPVEERFAFEEGGAGSIGFRLPPGQRVYGSGERGGDLRGRAFELWNTQAGGWSQAPDPMNINVPLFLLPGLGALALDNPARSQVDCAASSEDLFRLALPEGPMRLLLLCDPQVPEQLEAWTWATGRPPLPPRWALGFLQSKYGYRNEDQARELVDGFLERELPLGAIILDLYWFQQMGDLAWNPAAFPDPQTMIADFLELGVRTMLITEPYVTQNSQLFPVLAGSAPHYLAQTPEGDPWRLENWWSCGCDAVLMDFSLPDAATWWAQRHTSLRDQGIAGFWTDLGEPERHPAGMVHAGGSAAQVHNVYNLLWTRALAEHHEEQADSRFLSLSRSGWAGSQRYGTFTWSGDVARSWGGLQAQGPLLLAMGLSGFSWHGSDLGGFCCGGADAELYTRWLQAGALSPVMRAHGVDDLPTEPWGFGAMAEAAVSKAIRLRQELLPTLYTLAREAQHSGAPPVRPLWWSDPDFDPLHGEENAWLLGEDLLAAPVVDPGAVTRSCWLPEGQWFDRETGQFHQGRQLAQLEAPLDRLPHLLRAGALLVSQTASQLRPDRLPDTLVVECFPARGSSGEFRLYEDDGLSRAYLDGAFSERLFRQETDAEGNLVFRAEARQGSFAGQPETRMIRLRTRGIRSAPSLPSLEGAPLEAVEDLETLFQLPSGWCYLPAEEELWVQFPAPAGQALELRATALEVPVGRLAKAPGDFRLGQPRPNPANGQLEVTLYHASDAPIGIRLYDLAGRRVLEQGVAAGAGETHLRLRLDSLPSGPYFLEARQKGAVARSKLLIVN